MAGGTRQADNVGLFAVKDGLIARIIGAALTQVRHVNAKKRLFSVGVDRLSLPRP